MTRNAYQKLYEKHAGFYRTHKTAKKLLVLGNYLLTASVFFAYALLILVVFAAKGSAIKEKFFRIVLLPSVCLAFVSILRNIINRKRPYETGGILPVIPKKKKGHSFPSRHVSSAFVIGTVFLPYCVPAGTAILLAGILLAYIRFAAGLHYPSDLIAGGVIGTLFGIFAFL